MPPPRTVFIPTSEFKESQNKVFIPSSSGTTAGPVPAIPVAASPTISGERQDILVLLDPLTEISPTAAGLVVPVSSKQPAASNPVFHQERNGLVMENMMSISAMPGFQHMSVEQELRVADYNLNRQPKAREDLETARLQALRLDNSQSDATRTQKKEGLFGIPVPPVAAGPSNKATSSPPAVPSAQRTSSPPVLKGTETGCPGIAGSMGGAASTNIEGHNSTSPSSSNLGFGGFNSAFFKVPDGNVPLVPPFLGAGTGKSNQAGAAVVPPTSVPAPTANSAPQVHNAPQPSMLWSHTDTSHITFLLSPAAEVSFTVADAEKEWAYALRQAHETKVQLTKAQAAYDQAVATERLKFKAYSEARKKSDE